MRLRITHWKNDKTLQNPACLLTEIYYSNEKLSCTGGSTQRNLMQLPLRDNTASAPPFRIAGRLTEARRGDSSMQRTNQSHRSLHSHSAWRGESFMGCSAAKVVRFLWDWKLMLVSLPLLDSSWGCLRCSQLQLCLAMLPVSCLVCPPAATGSSPIYHRHLQHLPGTCPRFTYISLPALHYLCK